MDRRLLLFVVLSLAVWLIWTSLFPPSPPPAGPGPQAPPPAAPSGEVPPGEAPPGGPPAPSPVTGAAPGAGAPAALPPALGGRAGPAAAPALPAGRPVAAEAEETITIDTPLVMVRLTNRGARAVSWGLKGYRDDRGEPLDLVSDAADKIGLLPLQILVEEAEATQRLSEGLYRVERADEAAAGTTVTRVTLSWSDGRGLGAVKTLLLPHDSYMAEFRFAAEVGGRPVTPTLVWGAGFGRHTGLEKGQYADTTWAVAWAGKGIERRDRASVKPAEPWGLAGAVRWAGLEDKYFAALFVSESPVEGEARFEAMRLVEEGREAFHLSAAVRLPGAASVRVFAGPKDYDLLKGLEYGLDRLVDFGFFGVIALPLFYAMKFLKTYTGNYGWAIVILTIVIRLLFFPFMHRGQLKMRRMQDKMKKLQPKIKVMRERYRKLERKEVERGRPQARMELRRRMNEEMMAMYRQEDINPFGSMSGCLPLLLQIPILYAFYQILSKAIELRKAPFLLWITDLSQKDPYYVTPIIMGATMLIQQVMTSSSIPDPTQRRIMYVMPIMFTYLFVNFPSGLVLYWLVNNLLGIAQQYLVNKEAERTAKA
jgi:YidC/Oxa1 family membrane protein insertase